MTEYHTPAAVGAEQDNPPPNTLGLHRVMFAVDDIDDTVARLRAHGAELLGEVAQYESIFRLGYQRQLRGALFGDCNPLYDIPRLLGLYRSGDLKLEELITHRYRLDEVNDAYRDLDAGKNIRGVIVQEQ